MNKSKIDVPVFINFFNRPDTLLKVFEAVRQAKPSKLFLSCDGPREGRIDDVENIQKCQEIVEHVDWECEVFQNYSDINLGCGRRMYSGISWAFEHVEYLIILEDDCVPSQSFFSFCKDIFDRYKDDQRINMISGMNHCEVWDKCKESYFFAKTGSCWGWGTWKRAWKNVEYDMPYMEDENVLRLLSGSITPKGYGDKLVELGKARYSEYKSGKKLSAWTFQHGMSIWLNSQMIIVPKANMIQNVGLTSDSTHAVQDVRKIPRGLQKVFTLRAYDIQFPLEHPKYVIDDADYAKAVGEIMRGKYKYARKIESYVRRIVFADRNELRGLFNKAIRKIIKQ